MLGPRMASVAAGLLLTLGLGFWSSQAVASIVLGSTRIIYLSDASVVSVKLTNVGERPTLIQTWMDDGDADAIPDYVKVPFILTPPIVKIGGQKSQVLKLRYIGSGLPQDRESVFWLNVLEVPLKAEANRLQIVLRIRIKIFYRPVGLTNRPHEAAQALVWQVVNGGLQVSNPTPYHVSLARFKINGREMEGEMVAPYATHSFEVPAQVGDEVVGVFVNDLGILDEFNALLQQ